MCAQTENIASSSTLVEKITSLFISAPKPLFLHEPIFVGREQEYIKNCVQSGWVSSVGAYVDRFEEDLSKRIDGHAVATTNGTAALHLCFIIAGVKAGEEILTPNLSFVATANAVAYTGALPHFVDAECETFSVDPKKLHTYLSSDQFEKHDDGVVNKATGAKIRVLVVTHVFGMAAQMASIQKLCEDFNLILIEDAAEGLGTFYKEQHVGTFGLCAALSFNGNKVITTGGGGAFITKDKKLATYAKHLSTTAKTPDPYMHKHDMLGYNYRMPNINAALGCAQLENFDQFLMNKKALYAAYEGVIDPLDNVEILKPMTGTLPNHWLNTVILDTQKNAQNLIDKLATEKIHVRGVWAPLSKLPMYKNSPRMDLTISNALIPRTVNLPSSSFLADYVS
jgi:perosamine synthetase